MLLQSFVNTGSVRISSAEPQLVMMYADALSCSCNKLVLNSDCVIPVVLVQLQGAWCINPLTPNNPYRVRTAPLTSKRCILYIYSTNIGTKYFKHGVYSPFFPLLKMQFVS